MKHKNINDIDKKLITLYCLAYIKTYLEKVSEFIVHNMGKNILNFMDVYNILLSKNNNKNILSLKIYLYKYNKLITHKDKK